MKIGISLGVLRPSAWEEVTVVADALGYESVWMPEHMVIPVQSEGSPFAGSDHPPIPADVPIYDVFAYLGFLAAKTEQIHFGTQVYNIGLRHPFTVARSVTTLDVISQGRVEFGIGASWLEAEWEAVGLDFATRGRRVDEAIGVCRRLWSEEVDRAPRRVLRLRTGHVRAQARATPRGPRCTSAGTGRPPSAGPPSSATAGSR